MVRKRHVSQSCKLPMSHDCGVSRRRASSKQVADVFLQHFRNEPRQPANAFEPVPGGWECCSCFHQDEELCDEEPHPDMVEQCGCGHVVCDGCQRFG